MARDFVEFPSQFNENSAATGCLQSLREALPNGCADAGGVGCQSEKGVEVSTRATR